MWAEESPASFPKNLEKREPKYILEVIKHTYRDKCPLILRSSSGWALRWGWKETSTRARKKNRCTPQLLGVQMTKSNPLCKPYTCFAASLDFHEWKPKKWPNPVIELQLSWNCPHLVFTQRLNCSKPVLMMPMFGHWRRLDKKNCR